MSGQADEMARARSKMNPVPAKVEFEYERGIDLIWQQSTFTHHAGGWNGMNGMQQAFFPNKLKRHWE
jgi:hypothetical protein